MEAQLTDMTPKSAEIPDLPLLGHRNYWYPVLESRRLRKKPIGVQFLGERIVLFRGEGGKIAALSDRCAHRGALLSKGRVYFPGTLSCNYHGWTYNGDGECLAALAEGPDCKPHNVKIKSYPTEDRFGILWLFVGDMPGPKLEEDLPPALLEPGLLIQFRMWDWDCNWRVFTENAPDMLHAYVAHRNSLNMLFRKLPAYGTTWTEGLPDGKGLNARAKGAGMQAYYPGLGNFPRRYWWRVLGGKKGGTPLGEVRMPGYIVTYGWEPFLQFRSSNMQWATPIDENRTRVLNLNFTYPKNSVQKLALKLWYNSYFVHLHRQFLNQDRRLLEGQTYRNPERLSGSDIAVIDWRRLAARIARRPESESTRKELTNLTPLQESENGTRKLDQFS